MIHSERLEKAFAGKNSDVDIWLRDGLYALISDVLFIRDHKDPNRFHPRICVQFDFIYESLYDSDKAIFNKLYNDYYYRRNNQFWYQEAMKKLPKLVNATRMLVCAEGFGNGSWLRGMGDEWTTHSQSWDSEYA